MITWDAPLAAAFARALDARLGGWRLRAFRLDYGALRGVLHFREGTLVLRLAPDDGAVTLEAPAEPGADDRPLQAEVKGVEAPPDDRSMVLRLRRVRGGRAPVILAVELAPNRRNLVVAEGAEPVVRHVLQRREGERVLAPGAPWATHPSGRAGVDGDLDYDRWRALLGDDPTSRRGALLRGVAWTSPLNAPAILGRADREEGAGAESALRDGWRLWRRLAAVAAGREAAEPVVLRGPGGPRPYPLPLPGVEADPAPDLLAAVADASGADDGAALLPGRLVAALRRRVDGARGRVRGLRRELENAPDPAEERALGDLVLARFGDVPRGAASATLAGFDGEPVEVELDPALEPHENAEAYYDRAARAERARERLPGLVEEAEAEARRLAALLERAESGEAEPDEVRAALPSPESPGAGTGDEGPTLPYRRYRSSGGLEIRVGRGARHNDDLTFHHSAPDDVWLHARHAAGAHVVLRWKGDGNPPARDLAEAAVLAALHSRARTSGSVPVDWTRRKYVRKPRKAPPGRVSVEREQTLFVDPDPRTEERLRAGPEEPGG